MIRAFVTALLPLAAVARRAHRRDARAKHERRERIKRQGHGENFMKGVFGLTQIHKHVEKHGKPIRRTELDEIEDPDYVKKEPAVKIDPVVPVDHKVDNRPGPNDQVDIDPSNKQGKFKVGDEVERRGSSGNKEWKSFESDPRVVSEVADCAEKFKANPTAFPFERDEFKDQPWPFPGELCYHIESKNKSSSDFWYRAENLRKPAGAKKDDKKKDPVVNPPGPHNVPGPHDDVGPPPAPEPVDPPQPVEKEPSGGKFQKGEAVHRWSASELKKTGDAFSGAPLAIEEVRECADLSEEEKDAKNPASSSFMSPAEDMSKTDGICYGLMVPTGQGTRLVWYREERLKRADGPRPPNSRVKSQRSEGEHSRRDSQPDNSRPAGGDDAPKFREGLKKMIPKLLSLPAEIQGKQLEKIMGMLGVDAGAVGGQEALMDMLKSSPDEVIDMLDATVSEDKKALFVQMLSGPRR